MVGALDHMDGVDLDVAEMGDHGRHRRRAVAERRRRVQPLRPQPDMAGFDRAYGKRVWSRGASPDNVADSRT